MVTGAFMVVSPATQPVVQCFWLFMLALLFSGRWPNGVPPAWRTGRAEPWPTSAELREQRARAAAEARGEPYDAPAEREPAAVAASAPLSPSARKRKRKRK
jgi:hypothetical protein